MSTIQLYILIGIALFITGPYIIATTLFILNQWYEMILWFIEVTKKILGKK